MFNLSESMANPRSTPKDVWILALTTNIVDTWSPTQVEPKLVNLLMSLDMKMDN